MLRQGQGRSHPRGFSLIEALVALTIAALLVAMAAPSFSNWVTSSRIRTTAESILSGLQYARSAATARNAQVRFQLTTSVGSDCAISSSGSSWVVDVVDSSGTDSVAGNCAATPLTDAQEADDDTPPSILMTRNASETGSGTVVSGNASSVVYNGYGRLVSAPSSTISIMVRGSAIEQCAEQGGPITCLYIQIAPGGQPRMCNAKMPSTDPQSCSYSS